MRNENLDEEGLSENEVGPTDEFERKSMIAPSKRVEAEPSSHLVSSYLKKQNAFQN
jgi:hypothetical protein